MPLYITLTFYHSTSSFTMELGKFDLENLSKEQILSISGDLEF